MELISFAHGDAEYDDKYPDGIPTSIEITTHTGEVFDSGLVMYPSGMLGTPPTLRAFWARRCGGWGRLPSQSRSSCGPLPERWIAGRCGFGRSAQFHPLGPGPYE